jgi:hypothetical protein
MKKSSLKWVMLVALIFGGSFIVYLVWDHFRLQSEVEGFNQPAAPTDFKFYAYDYANNSVQLDGETDNYGTASFNIYDKDVTGLDDSEIDDLAYTDFALKDTKESGQSFTPEKDHAYAVLVNGTDLVSQWLVPIVGDNTVYMMNETEDVAMLAYSKDEMSTTVASSTYREWMVKLNCLDAAEGTGDLTTKEGYLPWGDFTLSGTPYETIADHNTMICLNITYAAAASLSYCDFLSGYSVEEKVSVNSTLYFIDATLIGSFTCEIKFASGLGTTFDLVEMEIYYGSESSLTKWDTQA